ncbi:hypothetical protein ES708_12020 [subsurface metagenome]
MSMEAELREKMTHLLPTRAAAEDRASLNQDVEWYLREATRTVEDDLRLEDEGWINLTARSTVIVSEAERVANVKVSRLYYTKDPLAKQAIRLWTDYTFGIGLGWKATNDSAQKALAAFWNAPENRKVLSARGQRKSSDKLLTDGEVFFAIFVGAGGKATIRWIDPLEISEIITDPEDTEKVMLYRRLWMTAQGQQRDTVYRDITNPKGDAGTDVMGKEVKPNSEAFVYYLNYNTISQRGNPLLLPALDWIRQYRRFLASRIAIMVALQRFATKTKVKGGAKAVATIQTALGDKEIDAGSHLIENLMSDTQPMRQDTAAKNAYDDGRQIKLMIFAAVGLSEQYFADISTGNLATAKTVELPMMKMFQSYQQVWKDTYQDIDEFILEKSGITPDNWYVDIDFPAIAPADIAQAAESLVKVLTMMPEFAGSPDVQQLALMILGINNPTEVLKALEEAAKNGNPDAKLLRVTRELRETVAAIVKERSKQ